MRGQRHATVALYPPGKTRYHCTGSWVCPRAGLDRCGKSRPNRDSIPGPCPARSLVAIPTELPSPFLNRSCMQMIINFTGYPSSCLPPVSGRRKIKTHKTIILCHVLWVCVKLVHREEQTLRVFVNSVLGKVTNSGEQSFLRKC